MRLPSWLWRLLPYLGRCQAEQDLQEELQLHLELECERQRDAGVPASEALRAAQRKLGNTTLIRERTRDVWSWRWLDDLGRDARHAVRGLWRSPGFAATVVFVLALGIGLNTAMFSVVYGMLVRPLPYPEAASIVRVGEFSGALHERGMRLSNLSLPLLQDSAESFEQLAAYQESSVEWASPEGTVTLRGAMVSPTLFGLLRAATHLGRFFTEEEARTGANRVVLLSHGTWRRRFGSDPNVVGAPVDFNGNPHIVVGVLEEGFYFPSPGGEFWTPFVIPPFMPPSMEDMAQQRMVVMLSFSALGRLRPGISPERAATEARTILQRTSDQFGGAGTPGIRRPVGERPEIDVRVVPLLEEMVGEYRPALLALTMATVLVLLIACTNVVGLLLARGVARQRTLAVCAALGAGRGRLVRQLLTESALLSIAGGALGLAVAATVLQAAALVPGDVARVDQVGIDRATLAFTICLSIMVGLVSGTAPAFQWSRFNLARTLNEGSAKSTGGFRLLRANRARSLLVTTQVSIALLLLIGAGLLLRSFVYLITIDRGYDPANVIAARARNPDLGFSPAGMTPEQMVDLTEANQRFQESLVEEMNRLERLPDVDAVGLSSRLPLANGFGSVVPVRVAGRPAPRDLGDLPRTMLQVTSPGYFEVMRLRVLHGRAFTSLDGANSSRVLLVNETLARQLFGGASAVGQRIHFVGAGGSEPWEVIGVVANVMYGGFTLAESQAEAFIPLGQASGIAPMLGFSSPTVVIRTIGDPVRVVSFLREAVVAAHPRATVDDVMTMEARLSAAVAQPRVYAVFIGSFAALAVFLAAFGLYGLLGYTVAQRRAEIGIRMAVGARRSHILVLVVRQGAALVAAGAAIGLSAAVASSRVLESLLFGISSDDPVTFVGAPVLLIAAAIAAGYLPARRATRVQPIDTLRFE